MQTYTQAWRYTHIYKDIHTHNGIHTYKEIYIYTRLETEKDVNPLAVCAANFAANTREVIVKQPNIATPTIIYIYIYIHIYIRIHR